MKLKDIITDDTKAIFQYYRDGSLWYSILFRDSEIDELKTFLFPVPIEDIGNATFNKEEKSILMMRYVRKWLNHT